MSVQRLSLALLLAVLALAPRASAQDEKPVKPKAEAFVTEFLAGLTVGEGIVADRITVFPILAKDPPAALGVLADQRTDQVRWQELEWPERPFDVGVTNAAPSPVLVLGGSLLIGGMLDRMVPGDVLLPAKGQLEISTLPAEYPKDRRAEPTPLRRDGTIAPEFLRERAVFDPSRYLVPIFISHFLEFRDRGDARRSLRAIDGSALLESFCEECQHTLTSFPDLSDGKVVGFATVVRGRLHAVELFGTNLLLRGWFGSILRAHAYAAAAIALRAEKLGVPLPEMDKEKALARAGDAVRKLLESLGKARYREGHTPDGSLGTEILIRSGRTQGVAIGHDGRLLHAAIYPENPFEEALFSRPIEPPPESSGMETSFGELDRRDGRGTLTEEEKRVLERMRQRRR